MLLCTWNHDPTIVNVSVLLATLNDALRQSPVLVQAYAHAGQKPVFADIPFPLLPASRRASRQALSETASPVPATAADDNEPTTTVAPAAAEEPHGTILGADDEPVDVTDQATLRALEASATVEQTVRALHLQHSIGYLRMMKLGDAWVPLEVQFGIPLFDNRLNAEILRRIGTLNLFDAHARVEHTRASRHLTLDLLDFVATLGGAEASSQGVALVPYPAKDVTFDGSVLSAGASVV